MLLKQAGRAGQRMRMSYSCKGWYAKWNNQFLEDHYKYKYNLKAFSLPLFIPILFQKCLAYKNKKILDREYKSDVMLFCFISWTICCLSVDSNWGPWDLFCGRPRNRQNRTPHKPLWRLTDTGQHKTATTVQKLTKKWTAQGKSEKEEVIPWQVP